MHNMACFTTLGPNELILVNALVSLVISDDLSADELNVLGNFIVAVGSLILTKAAELSAQQSHDNKRQLQELEELIRRIRKST